MTSSLEDKKVILLKKLNKAIKQNYSIDYQNKIQVQLLLIQKKLQDSK